MTLRKEFEAFKKQSYELNLGDFNNLLDLQEKEEQYRKSVKIKFLEQENKVNELQKKIDKIDENYKWWQGRLHSLMKIMSLIPRTPNNGFFIVSEIDASEQKEWIAKGWRLKDKAEGLEVWEKD